MTENYQSIKLDYSITDPAERVKLVEKILDNAPPSSLSTRYKEILANYIIFAATKEEKRQKKILTDGRMVTVNKRETSYEGLVDKLENGEDGIYNLMREDKNTLLSPKAPITKKDVNDIPHLRDLIDAIAIIEPMSKAAIGSGKRAYILKKTLIQMRQDQYVIRNGAKEPAKATALIKSLARMELPETIYLDEKNDVQSDGLVTLFNYKHVTALLSHYSILKQEVWDEVGLDMHYLLMDLEELVVRTLKKDYPLLFDLTLAKIDGRTNLEIQRLLDERHGVKHSVEYISALWKNKIPKLISEQAKEDWLLFHFTNEVKGKWKKCSRCGEVKLAHHRFFSRNKTSKDGYYSICKSCRNKKRG